MFSCLNNLAFKFTALFFFFGHLSSLTCNSDAKNIRIAQENIKNNTSLQSLYSKIVYIHTLLLRADIYTHGKK